MKYVSKAVSYGDGKNRTYSVVMLLLFLHAYISLKFQLAGLGKSDTITKTVDAPRSDRGRQWSESDGAESRVGQVRSGELESGRSRDQWRALAAGAVLPLQTRRIREAADWTGGARPDELSGRSQGIHGRLCESSSTWLGRRKKKYGKEGVVGKQAEKPQTLCF